MNYEEETATMGDKPSHGTDDGSRGRTKEARKDETRIEQRRVRNEIASRKRT